MSGSASPIKSHSSTDRKPILTSDFRNSTRFFLEKMFFRLASTLSFLAEGLSLSNANRTPTCSVSPSKPAASTMPMKGSTTQAASRRSASTSALAASLKPSFKSVEGSTIIVASACTMRPLAATR